MQYKIKTYATSYLYYYSSAIQLFFYSKNNLLPVLTTSPSLS
ncbi:MAG: hypothetical protein PHE03_13585 [Bacteroidales bacterium]|nr:hypothetical protein [Bacteroidales bacterium]